MSTIVKTPSTNSSSGGGSAVVQTTQLSSSQASPPPSSRIELTTTSPSATNNNTTRHATAASSVFPTNDLVAEKGGTEKTAGGKATSHEKNAAGEAHEPKQLVYPDDLRKILAELAQSGSSSVLRWVEEGSSTTAVACLPSSHDPGLPPRKRPKNGVYPRHLSSPHRTSGGLKRPLASTTTTARNSNVSGSEREDSMSLSPYDSEGTSVSEISVDRAQRLLNGVVNGLQQQQKSRLNGTNFEATDMVRSSVSTDHHQSAETLRTQGQSASKYRSLRQVLFVATGSALDYFFQHKGGYKLSPAEKRRNSILSSSVVAKDDKDNTRSASAAAAKEHAGDSSIGEEVFKQRKQRLLNLLSDADEAIQTDKKSATMSLSMTNPPFTIQRIAEVLLTPDRYYTQTHKLCNCLEKLLLVTSSIEAFGGTTGGDSSQTRREEQEMAALADERGRLMSEYRRKEIKRRMSASSSEGDAHMEFIDRERAAASSLQASREEGLSSLTRGHHRKEEMVGLEASKGDLQKEELLEAARASLRSKFDHVGIDPHSAVANANREHRNGNRSPPPPNLPGSAAGMALAGHAHSGLLRAHHDQEPPGAGGSSLGVRTPSPPMMFQSTAEGGSSPKNNSPTAIRPTQQSLQLLHMHHAAVLGGVSPFDLIGLNGGSNAAGASVAHAAAIGSLSAGMIPHMRELDVECRSSASSDIASSDLDSESDDISFDDSASDRSDGSDSGALPSANPAVARALALNRAQQQQQQPQRRMLASATGSAFSGQRGVATQQSNDPSLTNPSTGSGGGRVEAEYQSGDSIDSLRADDSDSSSDMVD